MRRAARIDDNQPQIVRALRSLGASVQPLSAVGQGCPDLLVGYRGATLVLEVKNKDGPPSQRALTPHQERWHRDWRGQLAVVHDITEALAALNIATP